MKPCELFSVLVKVVGLCAIVVGIVLFAEATINTYNIFAQQARFFLPWLLLIFISPAVLFIVGCFLLFGTGWIVKKA